MPVLDLPESYLARLGELLQAHVPDAEVWAYGSRVNGQSHRASDLDLVLRNPVDLSRPLEHFFKLEAALRESAIPILVDVRDWARLPEGFRAEIEQTYVVVQRGGRSAGSGDVGAGGGQPDFPGSHAPRGNPSPARRAECRERPEKYCR